MSQNELEELRKKVETRNQALRLLLYLETIGKTPTLSKYQLLSKRERTSKWR